MYCPLCKAEYRPGFTECSDCQVPLVDALGDDASDDLGEAASKDLRPVWRTGTEESAQAMRDLLEAEKIPSVIGYYEPKLIRGIARPAYWLAVRVRDFDRARAVVKKEEQGSEEIELPEPPLTDSLERDAASNDPFNLNRTTWGISKPRKIVAGNAPSRSDALDESEDDASYPATPADQAPEDLPPDEIPAEIDPEDSVAEIWCGESRDTADFLKMCLRENGIGISLRNDAGKLRISVEAADAARAKEIVREIIQGEEAAAPE